MRETLARATKSQRGPRRPRPRRPGRERGEVDRVLFAQEEDAGGDRDDFAAGPDGAAVEGQVEAGFLDGEGKTTSIFSGIGAAKRAAKAWPMTPRFSRVMKQTGQEFWEYG